MAQKKSIMTSFFSTVETVDPEQVTIEEGDTIYYASEDGLLTLSGVLMKKSVKDGEESHLVLACRKWDVPGAPVFTQSIRDKQVQCVAPRAGRTATQ